MAEPVFSIKSVDSGTLLEFIGIVPRDLEEWDGTTVRVALSGGPVSASVIAYDVRFHHWAEFFSTLASDWHSLNQELVAESLEGHARLTAAVDRLGHVALRVRLRGVNSLSDWSAEDLVALEVGQLERIAGSARTFFGQRHLR